VPCFLEPVDQAVVVEVHRQRCCVWLSEPALLPVAPAVGAEKIERIGPGPERGRVLTLHGHRVFGVDGRAQRVELCQAAPVSEYR